MFPDRRNPVRGRERLGEAREAAPGLVGPAQAVTSLSTPIAGDCRPRVVLVVLHRSFEPRERRKRLAGSVTWTPASTEMAVRPVSRHRRSGC